jgi:hypothetical protein
MAPVLVILPGLFFIGSFWLEAKSIIGVVLSVVISVLVACFLRKWFTEVNRMARETVKIYIQDGDLILEEAADGSVDGRKVKIVDFQWIRCDQINNGYRTYALLFSVVDLDGLPVHSHAGDELPVLECRGICGGREKRRSLLAFSTHSTAQVIKLNNHLGGFVVNKSACHQPTMDTPTNNGNGHTLCFDGQRN